MDKQNDTDGCFGNIIPRYTFGGGTPNATIVPTKLTYSSLTEPADMNRLIPFATLFLFCLVLSANAHAQPAWVQQKKLHKGGQKAWKQNHRVHPHDARIQPQDAFRQQSFGYGINQGVWVQIPVQPVQSLWQGPELRFQGIPGGVYGRSRVTYIQPMKPYGYVQLGTQIPSAPMYAPPVVGQPVIGSPYSAPQNWAPPQTIQPTLHGEVDQPRTGAPPFPVQGSQ